MNNMSLLTNKYGQLIWSEPDSHIAEAIRKKGIYDDQAMYYIERILKNIPDAVVLDIGAHIGNHALAMTQFSDMVYCFEPLPENVEVLQLNQHENHITNMQIFNIGLSDSNETLTFYQDGSTFVSGLQHQGSATQSLICRIGDEVLQDNGIQKIDFIKIDIEGFEPRALHGLKKTITASRPIVIMEWNNDATREAFKKLDLFNTIFKNYQVQAIAHNHHKFYFGSNWYSGLVRFLYRKCTRKRRMLIPFNMKGDYTNILLIPNEKISIINTVK